MAAVGEKGVSPFGIIDQRVVENSKC